MATPSTAAATARWVSQIVATGTDPGEPVDVDLSLNVDGTLSYLNNNSGASADDISSTVAASLNVFRQSGNLNVFDGTATLATVTNSTPPALTRSGDWSDPERDGDFSQSGGVFAYSVDVQTSIFFDDAVLVSFGEIFAIELDLHTDAFGFAGFEVEAGSDFFDTGSVMLSSDTPGIMFQTVPEPSGLLLLTLGAIGLGRRKD